MSHNISQQTNFDFFSILPDNSIQSCCGSVIPTASKVSVTAFQRFLVPITVFVSSEDITAEKTVLPFIGRIGDLKAIVSNNSSKVALEWTGADVGDDTVKVNYEIRYGLHLKDIVDNFEHLGNKWNFDETIPHLTGQTSSVTLNLANEPSLIGQPIYIAIKSMAEGGYSGTVSNYVRVFVPKYRAPPSPFAHDRDSYTTDSSSDNNVSEIFQTNLVLAEINIDILIAIVVCSLVAIILISICCWCCISRRRSFENAKETPVKTSPKHAQISLIVPTSTPSYNHVALQNQYQPENHHHSVDYDMMKPELIDQNKLLFDEMRHYQQQASLIDGQSDYIMSPANGTLSRNERYLSPVESWTASQLLHEHERRHEQQMEHEPSLLYYDSNGEMVPPIPQYPYGYVTSDVARAPPHYSSVYRTLVRTQSNEGSLHSVVSGAIANGDKKIRNVTMV